MKKYLLTLALTLPVTAFAAEENTPNTTGWDLGGGIGTASIELEPKFYRDLPTTKVTTSQITLHTAYHFTKMFGLEADIFGTGTFEEEIAQNDASLGGMSFTPKVRFHLNDFFSLYVKAGVQFMSYDIEYTFGDRTYNGLDYTFNAGAVIAATNNLRVKLDIKHVNMTLEDDYIWIAGDTYKDEYDLSLTNFTLSTSYQF